MNYMEHFHDTFIVLSVVCPCMFLLYGKEQREHTSKHFLRSTQESQSHDLE